MSKADEREDSVADNTVAVEIPSADSAAVVVA